MGNLGRRGTWRTSYEWTKLVLGLDPEGDPYSIALNLDQLALRGGQAEHFLKLCGCAPLDEFLNRPNLHISTALAKYRLKDAQGSRSQLREAIARYPYIFARLFQELNLEHAPKSIWGQKTRTNREQFECEVYVHNAKDLWNTPEAISLLVEVAESVERGPSVPTLDQDITLDEARHVLLSGVPKLIDLLPRSFTTLHTSSSDPLPPPDNLPSYSSTTAADASRADETPDGQPARAADPAVVEDHDVDGDEVRELNGLQNFFSRFLPFTRETPNTDDAFQRAATESGEAEEVIRQRGNRLVQLLHRVMGTSTDGLSQPTPHSPEAPDPTATETASAREDALDGEGFADMPNDVPADYRSQLGRFAADDEPSTSHEESYNDEKNQRWLAGQGMIRLRDFTAQHGADENAWGSHSAEGEALVSEYARRVGQLRHQRTRDFIVNYPLQQGTSTQVKDLISRYIQRQRP